MADPVEQQVAAFNSHDLAGFLACFADEAVVMAPDGGVTMDGKTVMRERYLPMFERADAKADVLGRLRCGRWVIDHERVSRGQQSIEALVAYEVRDDHIVRMIAFA